tara:strand:- start:1703 stop:2740 length:1038 start_codon:yes stop_codon:yes gene_type:complete
MLNYSPNEIAQIRATLTQNIVEGGVRDLSMDATYRELKPDLVSRVFGERPNGPYSGFIDEDGSTDVRFPLLPLQEKDPDLYRRVMEDPLVQQFSVFTFFPLLIDHINADPNNVGISYSPFGNRGLVAAVRTPDGYFIMKPVQSPDEARLVGTIGENRLGPRQYQSIGGYLTEELLNAVPLHSLQGLTPQSAESLGEQVAEMYRQLHSLDITYVDWIMQTDPNFKSHVLVGEEGPKLIDFGVATDLSKYPNFSPRDVLYFLYGDPMRKTQIEFSNPSEEQLLQYLEGVRSHIAGLPQEKMLKDMKEWDLHNVIRALNSAIFAGLWDRDEAVLNAFFEGFKTYNPHN